MKYLKTFNESQVNSSNYNEIVDSVKDLSEDDESSETTEKEENQLETEEQIKDKGKRKGYSW